MLAMRHPLPGKGSDEYIGKAWEWTVYFSEGRLAIVNPGERGDAKSIR